MIYKTAEGADIRFGINFYSGARSYMVVKILIPYLIDAVKKLHVGWTTRDENHGRLAKCLYLSFRIRNFNGFRKTAVAKTVNSRFVFWHENQTKPIFKQTLVRTEEQIEDELVK